MALKFQSANQNLYCPLVICLLLINDLNAKIYKPFGFCFVLSFGKHHFEEQGHAEEFLNQDGTVVLCWIFHRGSGMECDTKH